MNAKWFNIDQRDFDLINYFGMGFVKIVILLFFLFPYWPFNPCFEKERGNLCLISVMTMHGGGFYEREDVDYT